jgi:YbbR domain-containing protein
MNLFQRFTSRFRKNQKVYVFFICFLIAALFWFLLALTKDYTSSLNVDVMYSDFPSGVMQVNRLPEKFLLTIKANGYNLMSLNTYGENKKLNIDVGALIGPDPGVKKISSRMLVHDIVQQLGSDISVISIQPDTLVFNLSFSTSIKLPVKVNLDITFDRQYDSVSAVQLNPDSIVATVPVSYLGTVTRIETEKIKVQSLKAPLKKRAKLICPEGVSLNTSEVEIFLQVEKFTEGTVQVPVNVVNVPAGLTIKIYPDIVSVKYLVSLSHYAQVKPSMFTVTADASSASSDSDEKLPVEIITVPQGVRSASCQPQLVDFILKK